MTSETDTSFGEARVRMYRIGHGDCFLLSFPPSDPESENQPRHVLIDCGYKPGSQNYLQSPSDRESVWADIKQTTGGRLDLVVITHEHQDHVNGFTEEMLIDVEIGEAWFAWTESPGDPDAKKLRRRHRDTLFQLLGARDRLQAISPAADSTRLDQLLELELGGEDEVGQSKILVGAPRTEGGAFAASSTVKGKTNKYAMQRVKDRVREGGGKIRYFEPGEAPRVPGTEVPAFVLGPPRDPDLLSDEDPVGSEEFHASRSFHFGAAAVAPRDAARAQSPFADTFVVRERGRQNAFFREHYGKTESEPPNEFSLDSHYANRSKPSRVSEVPDDADWRRIEDDWLNSADDLALRLNRGVNNTSLVLAFELPSKKVLLFAGDAQRGNWISWSDVRWEVDGEQILSRDLLERTVLYKVGHHGSHNATLAGEWESEYANLSWMGRGHYGSEFTAMIPAVNEWAMTKNPPWRHPQPAILQALLSKASGRVFETGKTEPQCPSQGVSTEEWGEFEARCNCTPLFLELRFPANSTY